MVNLVRKDRKRILPWSKKIPPAHLPQPKFISPKAWILPLAPCYPCSPSPPWCQRWLSPQWSHLQFIHGPPTPAANAHHNIPFSEGNQRATGRAFRHEHPSKPALLCHSPARRVPSPLRRAQSGSCWLKQHAAYRQGTAKAPARSCHRPKYSASWFHSTCLETINFSPGNVLSNTSSTRFQALQAQNCSLLQHNSGLPCQHSPPAMGLLALKPRQSLPPPEVHPCPHGSVTASGERGAGARRDGFELELLLSITAQHLHAHSCTDSLPSCTFFSPPFFFSYLSAKPKIRMQNAALGKIMWVCGTPWRALGPWSNEWIIMRHKYSTFICDRILFCYSYNVKANCPFSLDQ